MRTLNLIFGALGAIAFAMVTPARADDIRGFWQPGAVIDYNSPVQENSSASTTFGDYPEFVARMKAMRKENERAEAILRDAETKAQQPQDQFNQPSANEQESQASSTTPLTRDQIIAKYGAPDQPRFIHAAKDAPAEMHGLFEALNSGDRDLAWQYSLAMARRNTSMQNMVSKATEYQMLAMEALGMRPDPQLDPTKDKITPERAALQKQIEETRRAEQKKKFDVEAALKGTDGGSEVTLEKILRSQPLEPVPVDPAGRVKLLVFFNEKISSAKEIADALRPLKNKVPSDANFSAFGLTSRTYAPSGLKTIGANTNFPYPLLNGEALSQEVQIQSYPTYLFVAVTSKQTYRLEGLKTAEELEKVIRLMKGVKGDG